MRQKTEILLSKAHGINLYAWVPCKRRSSVNSGAWLGKFDDVTRMGKSCVAKGISGKKEKEKYFIIANKYALPPNI